MRSQNAPGKINKKCYKENIALAFGLKIIVAGKLVSKEKIDQCPTAPTRQLAKPIPA